MEGGLLECWKKVQGLVREKVVSHSAVVLYLALLDKWRFFGKRDEFDMTNEKLKESAGFGCHKSLNKAKQELIEAGLIRIRVSKKLHGSKYSIL